MLRRCKFIFHYLLLCCLSGSKPHGFSLYSIQYIQYCILCFPVDAAVKLSHLKQEFRLTVGSWAHFVSVTRIKKYFLTQTPRYKVIYSSATDILYMITLFTLLNSFTFFKQCFIWPYKNKIAAVFCWECVYLIEGKACHFIFNLLISKPYYCTSLSLS